MLFGVNLKGLGRGRAGDREGAAGWDVGTEASHACVTQRRMCGGREKGRGPRPGGGGGGGASR